MKSKTDNCLEKFFPCVTFFNFFTIFLLFCEQKKFNSMLNKEETFSHYQLVYITTGYMLMV